MDSYSNLDAPSRLIELLEKNKATKQRLEALRIHWMGRLSKAEHEFKPVDKHGFDMKKMISSTITEFIHDIDKEIDLLP